MSYEAVCPAMSVTPVLIPVSPESGHQLCYPCLPVCPKAYCCPKPCPTTHKSKDKDSYRKHESESHRDRDHSPAPPSCRPCHPCPPPPCRSCHPCPPEPCCQPVKTKYVMPCYRYEDGRIVKQLPVTAFKRNGLQDQQVMICATNFIQRCPQDVSVECAVCTKHLKVADPAKVPTCGQKHPLGCIQKKKPIEVSLLDIVD